MQLPWPRWVFPILKSLKNKHLAKIKSWTMKPQSIPVLYPDITEKIIDQVLRENIFEEIKPAISLGSGIHSVKTLKEKSLERILKQSGEYMHFNRADFGNEFSWGVSTAAYQIEGAHDADGKGISIWDSFTQKKKKIFGGHHGNTACDFYNRYPEDIRLLKQMHIPNYRFSISWSRIFPEGIGKINSSGVEYYNRLIDACIEQDVEPWITLYHWDLPQALEEKGGWTNREILNWFSLYTEYLCEAIR